MVGVLGILDDLVHQKPVDKGCLVGVLTPAIDGVLEVGPKQHCLKVVEVPAWRDMRIHNQRWKTCCAVNERLLWSLSLLLLNTLLATNFNITFANDFLKSYACVTKPQ